MLALEELPELFPDQCIGHCEAGSEPYILLSSFPNKGAAATTQFHPGTIGDNPGGFDSHAVIAGHP